MIFSAFISADSSLQIAEETYMKFKSFIDYEAIFDALQSNSLFKNV